MAGARGSASTARVFLDGVLIGHPGHGPVTSRDAVVHHLARVANRSQRVAPGQVESTCSVIGAQPLDGLSHPRMERGPSGRRRVLVQRLLEEAHARRHRCGTCGHLCRRTRAPTASSRSPTYPVRLGLRERRPGCRGRTPCRRWWRRPGLLEGGRREALAGAERRSPHAVGHAQSARGETVPDEALAVGGERPSKPMDDLLQEERVAFGLSRRRRATAIGGDTDQLSSMAATSASAGP